MSNKFTMNKKHFIGAAVIAVVLVGVSFGGGIAYGRSHAPTGGFARGTFTTANGQFGAGGKVSFTTRGGMMGGGATMGQIVSNNGSSISVQLPNGSTQLVLLNSSTQIGKTVVGNASDLTNGVNVLITGQSNSDGSITAGMVQIRPASTTQAY